MPGSDPHNGHDHPAEADPELTAIVPAIIGGAGEFRHRQHIHLAFWAVRRFGMPTATGKVCAFIQHLAVYQRAPQKYHHTVSRAWMELVAHHAAAPACGGRPPAPPAPRPGRAAVDTDCADFDIFAARFPALLDKRLLSRHYRSATLASTQARTGWVEPDLLPFPWSGQDRMRG
jgi:hypothetical protein